MWPPKKPPQLAIYSTLVGQVFPEIGTRGIDNHRKQIEAVPIFGPGGSTCGRGVRSKVRGQDPWQQRSPHKHVWTHNSILVKQCCFYYCFNYPIGAYICLCLSAYRDVTCDPRSNSDLSLHLFSSVDVIICSVFTSYEKHFCHTHDIQTLSHYGNKRLVHLHVYTGDTSCFLISCDGGPIPAAVWQVFFTVTSLPRALNADKDPKQNSHYLTNECFNVIFLYENCCILIQTRHALLELTNGSHENLVYFWWLEEEIGCVA